MCGRFALPANYEKIENLIPNKKVKIKSEIKSRYNIAPTQMISVISSENPDEVSEFKWGLIPSWSKDDSLASKMINARSETIFEKPSFKNLVMRRRCLIPAGGYYEWKSLGKASKIPFYITPNEDELLTFAGLWDTWKFNDRIIHTTTIITCEPSNDISFIHNRMPVIIKKQNRNQWLELNIKKEDLTSWFIPTEDNYFKYYEVEKHVNNPSFDAELCLQPKKYEIF